VIDLNPKKQPPFFLCTGCATRSVEVAMLVRPVDHDKLVAIDRSGETVTDLMALLRASGACRVANHSCVSWVNFSLRTE
jgi:hypothetical protein